MAPVKNGCVIYSAIPQGYPVPGKTTIYDDSQTIDLDLEPLNGGVLVKVLYMSIDPFLRKLMQDPSVPSPFPVFEVGKPLQHSGVGVVVRSENTAVKRGDHVLGYFAFQEYVIVPDASHLQVLENKEELPWSAYIGVCGMTAQTAHHAWREFAEAHVKKGDVCFVTAASGAVGAIVVQLAKADGMKVIASAGSEEKVEWVRSIGADVAFNYKTAKTRDVLAKEGPVNIYWDNVGGEALDAALEFAAQKAQFIICGMISDYNTHEPYNVKNLQQIVWREITLNGFHAGSLVPKHAEHFFNTFPARVASGEMKYLEHRVRGLENAGQALLEVLKGENFGKCVLMVAEE